MKFLNIKRDQISIEGIPAIVLRPERDEESYPTVFFYHGWSSRKEYQEFRGAVIASLGYQVIIPDAIHHGDRGNLDYAAAENSGFFWETVLKNLEEWETISTYSVEKLGADPKRMAVTGHSMGGFTSAGIFSENPNIKSSVILNGSFNWIKSNEEFKRKLNVHMTDEFKRLEEQIIKADPIGNISKLKDRSILILHGESDSMVDITPQRAAYEQLKDVYSQKERIKMVSYPKLDHFVTTNMLEEMGRWFEENLMEV